MCDTNQQAMIQLHLDRVGAETTSVPEAGSDDAAVTGMNESPVDPFLGDQEAENQAETREEFANYGGTQQPLWRSGNAHGTFQDTTAFGSEYHGSPPGAGGPYQQPGPQPSILDPYSQPESFSSRANPTLAPHFQHQQLPHRGPPSIPAAGPSHNAAIAQLHAEVAALRDKVAHMSRLIHVLGNEDRLHRHDLSSLRYTLLALQRSKVDKTAPFQQGEGVARDMPQTTQTMADSRVAAMPHTLPSAGAPPAHMQDQF